ncbi:MAG TPA: hypothetical protein VFQ39_07405 [Longimicrobium sp.]|nr:hypothetical protein [Longimicrobium sp.]
MPDHVTRAKNDYEVTVHPAMASKCVLKGQDGEEIELYVQDKPFKLNGKGHPKKHTIKLKGGKFKRDITIEVDDPNHAIKHISIQLYGDDNVPGAGLSAKAVETFDWANDSKTCPPVCDPDQDPI